MTDKRIFNVEEGDAGKRLDLFLSTRAEDLSRSHIGNLIGEGLVLVNDKVQAKRGITVKCGDKVELTVPAPKKISAAPENIPIDILYEDECLAIVNKPKGMVVHPAVGATSGTLVNALMYKLDSLSGINGVIRPGIVHRLDKDTSGLLIIAKNDVAHVGLASQIAEKSAKRIYIAIVDGLLKEDSGTIEAPIGRSHRDRKKMAVEKEGRFARTDYMVLERFKSKTLVEFSLHTGRTHQIRVHCRHIGHPVTGDTVYGGDTSLNRSGQLLHARMLTLTHPITGEKMSFEAPIPEEMHNIISKLRKNI